MAKQKGEVFTNQKKLLKQGFTPMQILQMKELANKAKEEATKKAARDTFILMLAIPVGLLAEDYWEKSAKKRVPKFINDCLSLYDSYEKGVVTIEELVEYLREYGGIDIDEVRKANNWD